MTDPVFAELERSLGRPGLADALQRVHDHPDDQAAAEALWSGFPDVAFEICTQDN